MILVVGGAGYIGSLLVPELLALGKRVCVLDTFWFEYCPADHPNLEIIKADVRDVDEAWLKDVEAIIFLAGLSNDPTADFAPLLNSEHNVLAVQRIAEAAAKKAEKDKKEIKFIMASSCSIYYTETAESLMDAQLKTEDMPLAPMANYSKTKRLAEIELLKLADKYPHFCPVMMRKGTIFGMAPRMRFDLVVNVFTLHAWMKRQLTVNGSGEAWRPLLHIRDAVDAYLYSIDAPSNKIRGQIFNLLHKNYRVLELAHWIAEVLETHRNVEVRVKRNRSVAGAERSYFVSGEKIAKELGICPARGVTKAVLEIWDGLEAGKFGKDPQDNDAYYNIRWFKSKNVLGEPK